MGFDVSPDIAESDVTIENALIKRLTNLNQEIKAKAGFKLPVGQAVLVYNAADSMLKRRSRTKPGIRTVQSFTGIRYTLRSRDGKIQLQPRYRIKPV
jgi:hypothetical protein